MGFNSAFKGLIRMDQSVE